MKTPISLRMDEPLARQLFDHLFPGDGDEHGAIIAAGVASSERGTRLLAREVIPARDRVDYVPGTRGYRALTPQFIAEVSDYCRAQRLAYLPAHCHGGFDNVGFSSDDLASHERGYPALLDIMNGQPVCALVFAQNAVAGDVWTRDGRFPLDHMTIVGPRMQTVYARPLARPPACDAMYDRHARLFGDIGQHILSQLKIGIIGAGGGGSLFNEWFSRLGVGHIVAVDFDRITPSNLPRVVGATWWDAMTFLANRKSRWLRQLGWWLATRKVHVARRVARQANPAIRYEAIVGDVMDEATALRLTDVDFLVLASDSIQSRLVFNALVQQYLIPGVQAGAKVPVDNTTKKVADIFATTRLVLPGPSRGCLECHELIPPGRLREEGLSPAERRAQRYVEDDEIAEPNVITLNVLSAAQAANDFMMMFTGLFKASVELPHLLYFVRDRETAAVEPRVNETCPDCSLQEKSRRARGDGARLPCRQLGG